MAETEIKLTPEQQAALDLMLAGKNVFLTGEAGTGKSTILHKFKKTGRNQRDIYKQKACQLIFNENENEGRFVK